MEYIHVRNLKKFHPGYTDRALQWAKIHINMADGDPDTELIENEIDWARLIKIILLELRAQKPLPNTEAYWSKKGFNLKKRSMSLTLQMLHNFIEVVTVDEKERVLDKSRIEKSRVDSVSVTDFFSYFCLKTKKDFKLTSDCSDLITKRLDQGYTLEQLKTAVDNFVQDPWEGRAEHLELIYCIGKQKNKPDALEKWLNAKPKVEVRYV